MHTNIHQARGPPHMRRVGMWVWDRSRLRGPGQVCSDRMDALVHAPCKAGVCAGVLHLAFANGSANRTHIS